MLSQASKSYLIILAILIGFGSIHVIYQSPLNTDEITSKFLFTLSNDTLLPITSIPSPSSPSTPPPSIDDLQLQKAHYKSKKRERLESIRTATLKDRLADLQTYMVPQLTCPTMVRVGLVGDGGKFVCNPWRVPQNDCVIYSLGVNGDVSFETDIYEVTGRRCRIYSLDVGKQDPELFRMFNGVFVQKKMAGKAIPAQKQTSLLEMMREFNHTRIDILKMDIEGYEFETLHGFFNESQIDETRTTVCQILMELHHYSKGRLNRWTNLFEVLEKKGYRMYSREANMYYTQCFEFSYIHTSCLEQYGLSKEATYATFFD